MPAHTTKPSRRWPRASRAQILRLGLRALIWLVLAAVVLVVQGCSSPKLVWDPERDETDNVPEPEVLIGIPGGEDGLEFEPLPQKGTVYLETFGQGGTHAIVAVRCIGFGPAAYVRVTLRNLDTSAEVYSRTPETRARPLLCRNEHTCDLIPFLVMTSGLTEPGEEKDGLEVEVVAEVRNDAGQANRASQQAILSEARLPEAN